MHFIHIPIFTQIQRNSIQTDLMKAMAVQRNLKMLAYLCHLEMDHDNV